MLIQCVITAFFDVSPRVQLLLYAVPTGLLTLYIIFLTPEGLLRLALGLVARMFYRVTPVGLDTLPATRWACCCCPTTSPTSTR
ncbi:MAG: hypothetical protein WDO13_02585 [Verrucomicrobiota bacterium]